jgi:hypothetical protein
MYYKNVSNCAKTFYGVNFNPGDTKEVPGYINDTHMILETELKQPAKQPSSKKAKSESPKSGDADAAE